MNTQTKTLLTSSALAAAIVVSTGTAGAQEFQFVHASLNPSNHIDYPVNMDFVNRVEELSDGRIAFEVFEGGVLGDEREMMEQIATGTISTARLAPAVMSSICPEMSMLNLPFLYENGEELLEVARSDDFDAICGEVLVGEGIRPLDYWWMGVRDVYASVPIESLEDVAGVKLRTWQDPYVLAAWEALGAIPTPISFSELYTAMQTGTVDGAEGWAASYNSRSFYEVAPHLTRIGYIHIASALVISEQAWQSLPADLQAVVAQAAAENAEFAYETFSAEQNSIYDRAREVATVHDLTDIEAWREATAPVIQRFAEDYPGPAGDLALSLADGE
ncbi:MAG: TRAP transporter substrate-binding protein [Azospirillaceae bacterium]